MTIERVVPDLEAQILHVARILRRRLAPVRALLRAADAHALRPEELAVSNPREVTRVLRRMPLDGFSQVARAARAIGKTAPAPIDAIAASVVALSIEGSKIEAIKRAAVAHALAVTNGNVGAAARLLGIDRRALARLARK